MNKKYIAGFIVGLAVIVGILIVINMAANPAPTVDLSGFATCMKDKGIIMYGAWWCPHCAATKKMFGPAAEDLPYHECSNAAGTAQLQSCNDVGIQSYPTWVFPDGSRLTGEQTLQALADKSGCALPAGANGSTPTASTTLESSAAPTSASSTSVTATTTATTTLQ